MRAQSGAARRAFCNGASRCLERGRKEAPEEVKEYCTNHVAGSNRIVRVDVSGDYSSYNPEKWEATADVEFVNTAGAIQRTNLPFTFSVPSDYIFAHDDTLQHELDRSLAKLHNESRLRGRLLDMARDEALRRLDAGTLAGPREWTFNAGGVVLGTFVRFQGTNGVIVRKSSDGREYLLQLDLLTEYDKDYIDLTQRR